MGSPALRLARDWSPPVPLSQNPLPALALIWAILGCVVFWSVGYLSGKNAERGSQLGQVLALAPQRDSVEAALAWARTLQSRLAKLAPAARPPQNTLRMPREPTISPQQVPVLPLPQIRP